MNKFMFGVGIMIMLASDLLFVLTGLPSAQITVLLIIGIVLAGATKFRILKA